VVTQSAGAFATSVAAFSLIITQFESLSSLAAVMSRLNSLVGAVDGVQSATFPLKPSGGQPLLAVQPH
jgi:putative ATP-binding cassette transporter